MSGSLYLAWRYVVHHRYKSAVLVASITIILFLPGGLRTLVHQSEAQLAARAQATPLLIGKKGSPVELVLNSLYFSADVPETASYDEVQRVASSEFAQPIPLYVRFRSQDSPIVGTTLDYFALRSLRLADGRQLTRLGDCVLGANVASRRGLEPGDHVFSSPETVFDLAGVYPLKMRITGILAPSDSADDDAIFVDVRTTWVIEGLAHGHDEIQPSETLLREEGNTVANASVMQFNEITDENVDAFHFHGDPGGFPITAVIAVPPDDKSGTLLMGRYEDPDERHQILRPAVVMDELLATVLTVQAFVVAALSVVGIATLATAVLVFLLSLRLRRREIETMVKIGGSRSAVTAVMVSEVVGVLLAGFLLAAFMTWLTAQFGSDMVRALVD